MTGGERGTTRLVGFALYGLIAYIVLSAGVALVFRFEPEASPLGIGLTIASLLIMAALWRWRLALALIAWEVLPFAETRLARWSACTWRALPWPDSC